jgi:hypothetical protein
VSPANFMHPNDHLILEDESGRVKLVGEDVCAKSYVTGMFTFMIYIIKLEKFLEELFLSLVKRLP